MSRAFGNRMLKQYVVAEPEIQVITCVSVDNSIFGMCEQKYSSEIFQEASNNFPFFACPITNGNFRLACNLVPLATLATCL